MQNPGIKSTKAKRKVFQVVNKLACDFVAVLGVTHNEQFVFRCSSIQFNSLHFTNDRHKYKYK